MVIAVKQQPVTKIKKDLLQFFKKLDTMIAVHYQTNYLSYLIKFDDIRKKILGLKLIHILKIKHIYPESYTLSRVNENLMIDVYSHDKTKLVEARTNLFKNLNERLEDFERKYDKFVKESDVPITSLEDIPNYKMSSIAVTKIKPHKVIKSVNNKKLANHKSKFEFKEAKDPVIKGVTKLSLLERIRLKEKANCEGAEDKQQLAKQKREALLSSKMEFIYNIVYEQSPKFQDDQGADYRVSLPMNRIILLVKDSTEYDISEEDIIEVVRRLSSKVARLDLIQVGEMEILKIGKLDREQDLLKLKTEKTVHS
ncbi:unnamed protein product [Ambrosiozyma monospora]|uniref:Unnamed protein product n=1 Tax=Ambrosiozyma monospora TaxID=43982 RepID=A0A9W6YMG3_AMBMO|nr:unnamed protein product [Ambrosiozyma monospora]